MSDNPQKPQSDAALSPQAQLSAQIIAQVGGFVIIEGVIYYAETKVSDLDFVGELSNDGKTLTVKMTAKLSNRVRQIFNGSRI